MQQHRNSYGAGAGRQRIPKEARFARAVRIATALLLAASLAACNASTTDTQVAPEPETQTVGLASEVASGLPLNPGSYGMPGGVFRDQRGVYQFEWLETPGTGRARRAREPPASGAGRNA